MEYTMSNRKVWINGKLVPESEAVVPISEFYNESGELELEVGDEVLNDELNKIKVVSVEKIDGLIETYNINRTNNGKNYFANRVLVSDESETE